MQQKRIEVFLRVLTIAIVPSAVIWAILWPFSRFYVPLGWDTPGYLGYTLNIYRYGWNYTMNPESTPWKGLRVISSIPLLVLIAFLGDLNISYVVWTSSLALLYLVSMYYVSKKVLCKPHPVFYSFLFTSLGYNYLRLTHDLFDQMLGLTLTNIAIGRLVTLTKNKTITKWHYVTLFVPQLLTWFTHLETAVICWVVLTSISLYTHFLYKSTSSRTRNIIACLTFSLIIGTLSWALLLTSYNPLGGREKALSPPWRIMWKQVQHSLIILQFLAAGRIAHIALRRKANVGENVLFVWMSVLLPFFLVSYYLNPDIMYRVLFFFPVPLLLAYGVDMIMTTLEQLHTTKSFPQKIKMHIGTRTTRILGCAVLTVLILIISFDAYKEIIHFGPWISSEKVAVLQSIAEYASSPDTKKSHLIFVLYPPQRTDSTPGAIGSWIALYDNWIQTYVGHHLTYYGPLENLLTGEPMDPASYEEGLVFQHYWSKLDNNRGISNLTDYLVIFIPDWYSPITSYETSISEKINEGFYVVKTF